MLQLSSLITSCHTVTIGMATVLRVEQEGFLLILFLDCRVVGHDIDSDRCMKVGGICIYGLGEWFDNSVMQTTTSWLIPNFRDFPRSHDHSVCPGGVKDTHKHTQCLNKHSKKLVTASPHHLSPQNVNLSLWGNNLNCKMFGMNDLQIYSTVKFWEQNIHHVPSYHPLLFLLLFNTRETQSVEQEGHTNSIDWHCCSDMSFQWILRNQPN